MIESINIPKTTATFTVVLDGFQVEMKMYYSKVLDRFLLDVLNKETGEQSVGIAMNTGIDLLNASGHTRLQALVLLSSPPGKFEGELENYAENLTLVYMDLDTYNRSILGETAVAVRTPSELYTRIKG